MAEAQQIPVGYMKNAAGHLVPEQQVREHDKLRDRVTRDLVAEALLINDALCRFKAQALADIDDVIAISSEKYGVTLGGKKGNVSITTFDGRFKIERAMADRLAFTEEILAAKELIYSCVRKWSADANPHLVALVDRAFTGRNGQIRTNDVLGLLRLEIDDPEWKIAMVALKDAIQVNGQATYVRVYQRVGETDRYEPINLNIAAV
ncbi:DUF3164 family protein [Pseudomonas balearica]|uniref:DUF3164 family protein n=1 Tax=Stutzerimonas balearica TaxID=74829 RepID=UPI001F17EBFA|nr:DUF3164 family protein [Stutzerimonas balearica]MCF6758285.1 DUF3164 family protein [Stutzerimonas balearica]